VVRRDRVRIVDEVDLTRTVGAFEHVHPVALTCAADEPPAVAIRSVKEHLRSVPTCGIGWQLLRQDADPLPDPAADLTFSYLKGEPSSEFGSFTMEAGVAENESPHNLRPYPLELCVSVTDGVLTSRWTYSRARHRPETIAQLAERYAGELRTMIELGTGPAQAAHVPSDFPLAHVDQAQLDELLGRL
jgi:non-ribosomal peptide synthase protein (TIGR01720 family)